MNACCGFHLSGQCATEGGGDLVLDETLVTGATSSLVFFAGPNGELSADSDFTFDSASSVLTVTARVTAGELRASNSGDAGTPSIHFGTDPDTGFFRKAANTLGITCGGAEVGNLSAAGPSFAADTDAVAIFGRTRFDSRTTDQAVLSHFDMSGASQYAVKQLATGRTQINSASGQSTRIRNNEVDRIIVDGTGIGFFGTVGVAQQNITGAKGGNAALADLLTKLAAIGLITDATT